MATHIRPSGARYSITFDEGQPRNHAVIEACFTMWGKDFLDDPDQMYGWMKEAVDNANNYGITHCVACGQPHANCKFRGDW